MPETSTPIKVVFVDDYIDEEPIWRYPDTLERKGGCKVTRVGGLFSALDLITTLPDGEAPDIWIVDIMMPVTDKERLIDQVSAVETTRSGMASGIVVHRKIRDRFKLVPIILLTTVSRPEILEDLSQDEHTLCVSKINTLPRELVKIVLNMLNK